MMINLLPNFHIFVKVLHLNYAEKAIPWSQAIYMKISYKEWFKETVSEKFRDYCLVLFINININMDNSGHK